MHRHRPPAALAATILCLIALAACGTDTTAQFKSGYAAARVPLNRTLEAVATTLGHPQGRTAGEITRRLGVLSSALRRQLQPLLALRPPAAVSIAFGTLRSSMRRVDRDLQGTYAALRGQNLPAAKLAVQSMESDARDAAMAGIAVGRRLAHR